MAAPADFRWQALFQHAREPVFVLSRRRRLLFANRAWEELTGRPLADARGLTCSRRETDDQSDLSRTLSPPPGVMRGQSARVQRPAPGAATGPPWWEIAFLPLSDAVGVIAVVGTIAAAPADATPAASVPLSESRAALRTQAAEHYRLDALDAARQPTVLAQARLAAASRCPVYVVGEPGAGKHWLARAIHHASDRRHLPFVALDCAHLPAAALRAVLATAAGRPDRLGTLYLREPAALPRELQADLAAAVADDAGPRVIAGTAAADDPKRPVFLGQMLPELYDALAVLVVPVPPLRARKDELTQIVDTLLRRAALVHDQPVASLSAAAWECVRAYPWPGNLRELNAALLRAVGRTGAAPIDAADLPLAVQQAKAAEDAPASAPATLPPLDTVLEEVEKRMIRLALDRTGGNQSKAAELLGVWRPRLIRRIKALGLDEPA